MKPTTLTPSMKQQLRNALSDQVQFDLVTCGIHATDASHYQIMPACVATPRDVDEVQAALRVSAELNLAITPRGGATALSGQTFGPGMVLDLSRHFTNVLEINPAERWARVQAGVVRDQLNNELAEHGLQFAPDPATTSRATVGGMMGNNSAGMRSILHGKTIDHVLSCRVVLADGSLLECEPLTAEQWKLAEESGPHADVYAGVRQVVEQKQEEILARFPKVMRRVSGYNLDEFVDGAGYTGPIGPRDLAGPRDWNLANLIVGSEGTLGTIVDAKVRLVPAPKHTGLCVVHFENDISSLEAVAQINEHGPSAVELLDCDILREAKTNASTRGLTDWVEGDPAAILMVEFSGEQHEVEERIAKLSNQLQSDTVGYAHVPLIDARSQKNAWETRRMGLGLLSNRQGSAKGQACVEDACLPVDKMPQYIAKLREKCDSLDVPSSIYAHASVGVIHFRPVLDLHLEADRQKMREITEHAFELTIERGGAFAGEHGDGQLRGEFVPKFFGPQLYEAFRQIKRLFDPDGRMNPGKIVEAPSMIDPTTLRYGTEYQTPEIATAFRYEEQGGFRMAVEQCNGVGACRKVDAGTMCPSYMATRDEQDSTRGRANALRLAMSGQLNETAGDHSHEALASDEVHKVLELCLSCKACKTECPNAVDMSRLKADALQMRYEQRGVPLAARLLGSFPDQAKRLSDSWLMRKLGQLGQLATHLPGARTLIGKAIDIDPRRELPQLAPKNLQTLLAERCELSRERVNANAGSRGRVVLFDDTYANYLEPQIGLAAVNLLESLGFEVILAKAGCCQRPRMSLGLLDEAKSRGAQTIANLDVYAQQGLPILCLEPSCASALAGDLPDLVDNREQANRVAKQVQLLEHFLAEQDVRLNASASEVLLHGHCHQKALFGTEPLHKLFDAMDNADLQEVDSGCCGMAGSFGYTHYDLSEQIGEDRLFPAVREATAEGKAVIAPGTSCRQQLKDFLGVDAKHWVEIVDVINEQG